MAAKLTDEQKAQYECLFKEMDTDGSGQLSRRELVEGLQALLKGDRKAALSYAVDVLEKDENQDNKITLEEFFASLEA